ncbi:hypothetical protein Sango_2963000 [Sesamum angolense]|uniref:RNase H type-1 domain-containing protein n=1 Tax=Sesamum angolense TaxID=2727404 RepID=A0AAE1T4N0_9LAMI|nr:hypothetical protein Sango_2963000 [Sesamum angolense]
MVLKLGYGRIDVYLAVYLSRVPNRVKLFAWKLCKNAIPTATNLVKRKVDVGVIKSSLGGEAHVRNEVGETRRGTAKWYKPPAGSFKLNFDAAIHKDLNGAGAGVVVRNNEGCCIRWSSKFFPGIIDLEQAAALAARVAAILARDLQLTNMIVEGDCLSVIKKLKDGAVDDSYISPIIQDIKKILSGLDKVEFNHVKREGNMAAHFLVRNSISQNYCFSILPEEVALAISVYLISDE